MATEAIDLDKDAFMRLVTQEHLDVKGPSAGYLYAGKQGKTGWEVYRTPNNPWYLYQARRVFTNTNAAGGAMYVDIQVPSGTVAQLVLCYGTQTTLGTHVLGCRVYDEDNAQTANLAYIGTAATNNFSIPSVGTAANTNGNFNNATGFLLGPGMKLTVYTPEASAQDNDTLTVAISLLLSTNNEPTWSVARSTNAGDITEGVNTISTPMILVAMP